MTKESNGLDDTATGCMGTVEERGAAGACAVRVHGLSLVVQGGPWSCMLRRQSHGLEALSFSCF